MSAVTESWFILIISVYCSLVQWSQPTAAKLQNYS